MPSAVQRLGLGALLSMAGTLALLALPPAAAAHASLERARPEWNAVLGAAPRSLKLVFDEEVNPHYARVAVVTPGGRNLAGLPRVMGNVVVLPLRPGQEGSYTVRWRMVASDDGHATEGAYSFGVRAKPLPPAPAHGVAVPIAPQLLAWLQFLGVVLAGGVLTFRALVWAPAARRLGEAGARESKFAMWAGAVGAVVGLHAGVLAFLAGAYPVVGGGLLNFVNTEIEPIRVGTHLGQAWTLMTFAWLGVLGLLVAAWVTPRKREPLLAYAGALALAIAFGLSWASHPAARGSLTLVTDYVHLLAGALWVGGLVALAALAAVTHALPGPAREALVRTSLLRLSRMVVPTVVVLALAGAYLALRELPAPSALLTSGYGLLLVVKTIVALAALALGGYHNRFVVPRIAAGAPVATIRRTLAVEVGFLLAALVLAATLSQTAPPG